MPPKKSSGEKKKTAVNTRKKTAVNTIKKTAVNTIKKTVSSEKKASSSKKPTKSSILSYIKIIAKMMIFIIISAFASKSFINVSKDFTTFLAFIVATLPLSIGYTVGIQTPTKLDSKKNVIKLPLSKFKLYIKKLLSVVNPIIFYLGSTLTLITAIIFIKTFIELAHLTKDYDYKSITQIYNTLIDSYKSDLTVYNALSNISYEDFYDNSIVSLLRSYYPADKINDIINSATEIASSIIKKLSSLMSNLGLGDKPGNVNSVIDPYANRLLSKPIKDPLLNRFVFNPKFDRMQPFNTKIVRNPAIFSSENIENVGVVDAAKVVAQKILNSANTIYPDLPKGVYDTNPGSGIFYPELNPKQGLANGVFNTTNPWSGIFNAVKKPGSGIFNARTSPIQKIFKGTYNTNPGIFYPELNPKQELANGVFNTTNPWSANARNNISGLLPNWMNNRNT